MGLRREHKGVEGYFYKSGNKKLEVQPGLIDRAKYSTVDGQKILDLQIGKTSRTHFTFEIIMDSDISSLFEDLQVSGIRELNALPENERLVLVYNNNGVNYGISVDKRGRQYGRLRI